jgi:hypothetical protein
MLRRRTTILKKRNTCRETYYGFTAGKFNARHNMLGCYGYRYWYNIDC